MLSDDYPSMSSYNHKSGNGSETSSTTTMEDTTMAETIMAETPTAGLKPDNLDQDIDALLANDLLKMSFHDRNEINEETHGVRSLAVEETPQLIANSLRAFRIELGILPPEKNQAYLYILQRRQQQQQQQFHAMNPYGAMNASYTAAPMFAAYADSDEFRLRFLRCLFFDVPRAVRRFANYLNFVQDYWGDSFLARPIQMSDLNTAEMKVIKKAWTQLFPFRDRRGRRIIALLGNGLDLEDVDAIKAGFYILDVATRDSVQSQRDGLVAIVDGACWKDQGIQGLLNIVQKRAFRPKFSHPERLYCSVPFRVAATHFCWPDSPIRWAISSMYMFGASGGALFRGRHNRSESAIELNRCRIHTGTETEMRYKVKAYGIPIELLPLTGTNVIKQNYHNQWIKTRKLVESNLNRYHEKNNINGYKAEYEVDFEIVGSNGKREYVKIVECPCANDVVFRNGTQSMENPGNAMFRNAILSYWAEKEEMKQRQSGARSASSSSVDDSFDREFRDQLVWDIEVKKKGRFLEWDKKLGVWIHLRDKTRIQRKVAMAFYNYTKRRYNHGGPSRRRPRDETSEGSVNGGGTRNSRSRSNSNSNSSGGGSSSSAAQNPVATDNNNNNNDNNNNNNNNNYQFIDPIHWDDVDGGSCCYGFVDPNRIDDAMVTIHDDDDDGGNGMNKRSCLAWPFASAGTAAAQQAFATNNNINNNNSSNNNSPITVTRVPSENGL